MLTSPRCSMANRPKPRPSPLLEAFAAIAVRLAKEELAAAASATSSTSPPPSNPRRAA